MAENEKVEPAQAAAQETVEAQPSKSTRSDSHVKHGDHRTAITVVLVIVLAAIFSGYGWFVYHPDDLFAMASVICFGIGLAVGLWLLAWLDGNAHSRFGRFCLDFFFGAALIAFIWIFLLGLTFYFEFFMVALGVLLILSALFTLRKV
ncbi:hypothetical protein [Lacticaseibacillus yichunensis]|uniref:Uncharacterized protein n=1 Tax=Lacticaseibacillus yichunensis TaxID=2486015 RepID=A0ABW4CNR3_9LACO|nr:hypothetical protein [Lacticaseibacillus yichunensis]